MNLQLFLIVVFSWGFSWYAITLQIGEATALVALSFRFILAATAMCVWLFFTGRWNLIAWRDQKWVAALGFCLFSMNFLSFYLAAFYLPSGLLSVIFATAAIFGAINARVFLQVPIQPQIIVAAALGVTGLCLLLLPEMDFKSAQRMPIWAIALPIFGTFVFSIGNLISARLCEKHDLPNIIGQGMAWGAIFLVLLCFAFDQKFSIPRSSVFWGGVVYLALVSSLLAFSTYLTLVNRVGTARAAYATVLFPIVAMFVSTYAEGYQWTGGTIVGLALVLVGTILTFRKHAV